MLYLNSILPSLIGGILIGLSVTLMLLFNGRVTGISGIISGLLNRPKGDTFWRLNFLVGLLLGGLILSFLYPNFSANTSGRSLFQVSIAGLLVGFGTVMGGGCTSGHGVCGISRFSFRSTIATLTFMIFGVIAVALVRFFSNGGNL